MVDREQGPDLEVAAEGLVRNLPIFGSFLSLAALSDTEPVNYSTFARDVGVSSQTIKDYYQILVDTLLGFFYLFTKKIQNAVSKEQINFIFLI